MRDSDVYVVVPIYNEVAVLADVLGDLTERFENVICVDDGSSDGSGAVAASYRTTVLRHAVNLGQGAALRTGFEFVLRHTDARFVVTFDADGQHASSDALTLLELARTQDLDVVLGSRHRGNVVNQPRSRRLLLNAGVRFSRRSSGLELTDTHNGLRVLSRHALTFVQLRQHGMAYASELENAIARHRLTWAEAPVSISYTDYSRRKGQKNINALNVLVDLAVARIRAIT